MSYLLSFPRYNDLLVENLRFLAVVNPPFSFEALTRDFSWTQALRKLVQKTRVTWSLSVGENCMIIRC